ncbi:putative NADH dehydrogenase [Methanocella conradii HZ254]|uniref:NADH dehydrogenase n=1 Tax=Methanocella conradii (strain DSM 24694 / JCM 17849 / CGMCC 1.5162 / HZ254) TaxID=1041930 RepID=H8IAB2_METCZ|nr:FAD-dependent oxidoreductase [Methanocella conradii]AFC99586.1 putative NADH dehydrogenase [Methanocella conradii HZ254]
MRPDIVFIGAGGAGLTAAFIIARKRPETRITLFSRDPVVAYSQCGMPFVLDNKIESFDRLILYTPEVFKDLGLDVRTGVAVTGVDLDARAVTLEGGETVEYGKLVFSTGSIPFIPSVPGVGLRGVHRLLTLEDGRSLARAVEGAKSAVIIGGGPIGLETAPAFLDRGIEVTIVERMPHLMPSALDPDMAVFLEDYLKEMGATIITGKGVESINGAGKVESVTVGGETIKADLVLMAAGVRPNVELAKKAGIDIGPAGGIDVDERFRVKKNGRALDDVYAAGDCIEEVNAITGRKVVCAIGTVANRQARFLAEQLMGNDVPYGPVLCPAIAVVGDLHVGSVGLTTMACEAAGIKPVSFKARSNTRARYYPGGSQLNIKLIADGERIVGAQLMGKEGVHGRVNQLTLAIHKKMTPSELADVETCYAPPVSPMIDPITYAAEMLALRCKKGKR